MHAFITQSFFFKDKELLQAKVSSIVALTFNVDVLSQHLGILN